VADGPLIEAIDLRKTYDGSDALRGLSVSVPRGSIFGFLGRNGAGKTTALKILMGMTRPTGGAARVFGLDATDTRAALDIRRRTGFVSEEKELYAYMTVGDMIRFTAGFYPKWRVDLETRYLRMFSLPAGKRIKTLSQGMRTKLALLLALSRGAELLMLDEPTAGLDPAVTEEVLQTLISHVAAEELTVFFSSHQIAEVDQIADHVAIVHEGHTALTGALDDLRETFRRVQLVFADEAPDTQWTIPGVLRVRRQGRVLTITAQAGTDAILSRARTLNPVSTDVIPLSLKDMFLEVVSTEN
jgi:ABC-2 type transport system ATP-binding protein